MRAKAEGAEWSRWQKIPGDGGVASQVVHSLENGKEYTFEVRSSNRAGEGKASSVVAQPYGVPGAPTDLEATGGDGRVALSWEAGPDNGAEITDWEYRMKAKAEGAEWSRWQKVPGDGGVARYVVGGLENGKEYTFEVRSLNRAGASEGSGEVVGQPYGVPDAPAQRRGFTPTHRARP